MKTTILTLCCILLPCAAMAEMSTAICDGLCWEELQRDHKQPAIKTTLEYRRTELPPMTTLEWRQITQPTLRTLEGQEVPEKLRELSRQSAAKATAAASQLRIVRCTDDSYAVQEYVSDADLCASPPCWMVISACGNTLESARAARAKRQAEIYPPRLVEPIQVVEP